ATKLYNAWLAGVPAILGPEIAYRHLRRSELDYIEVNSAAEALEAIERLRSDHLLYQAMIDNGVRRAEEFTVGRLTREWTSLLFDTLPAAAAIDRRVRFWRNRPLWSKELARRAARGLGLWK
ncbi:MAG: hypothetical protein ABW110_02105, partial [Steroidobacteraceae bacterium]